jgi:hypothetical protein
MKRFFTIVAVGLFLANSGVFAEKQALIDFTKLAGTADANDPTLVLDKQTTINYGFEAGASFSKDEKAKMKTSLAITSWDIVLASSAQTVTNQSLTQIKVAKVAADSAFAKAGDVVLGARIHFPDFAINSYAVIKPPFTIPAYATLLDDNGNNAQDAKQGDQFVNNGVIKNVGVIKSIQINVLGRQFPNTLSLLLEDQNGEEQEIQMGSLKFDGWNSLVWNNPDYQSEVRNRELKVLPLYPRSVPFIKLKGILIHRDGANEGGDFVTYIKDINVIFDQARVPAQTDVEDEALWGIITEREKTARQAEIKNLGAEQVLRNLEKKKLATETGFDAGTTGPGAAAAAPAATPAKTN